MKNIFQFSKNNRIRIDKSKNKKAGNDFIIGSLTFMCIKTADNIKKAIPAADGIIVSGIQNPARRPIENVIFKKPTV